VLAAGAGTRVGGTLNKVLLPVAGVPIVARSVRTACAVPDVERVVLVVRDGEQETVRAAVEPFVPDDGPEVAMVVGGASRHGSEWAALQLLAPSIEAGELDVVAVHDAARPCAGVPLYEAVLAAAVRLGGAIPVTRWPDVVSVEGSPSAHSVVGVQTPQAFRADELLAAHRAAARDGFEATDTAGCLAAYAEVTIGAIESGPDNLKVTVADDVRVAEAFSAG
jgi:2-C-methyl-D-erythritol 4-phosphate cytidylyltransferase